MRILGVCILTLLLGAPLFAQETLIDGSVDFGGYGGPFLQFTSVNKQFGLLVGGGGGVILDHTISLGAAGYGLVNDVTETTAPASTPYLNLAYGGVYLQYTHHSDALLHATAGILIGAGGISFRRDVVDMGTGSQNGRDTLNDAFFVVEPSVEGELNVTKYFRIAVGGSYRFVSGVSLYGLGNDDISGPSARLMFKFGSF